MKFLAMLLAAAFLIVANIIVAAFFVKLGWNLFAVPMLGAPVMGWLPAFGFGILTNAFRQNITVSK
jgi:hypothetical protein